MTSSNYPTETAREVAALRPDLCAGDAVAAVLTADPTLTAAEVIEALDEAADEHAAAEITDSQIRRLRTEAAEAGDTAQVDLCDAALATTEGVALDDTETTDSLGGSMSRVEARAECARVIAEASANA